MGFEEYLGRSSLFDSDDSCIFVRGMKFCSNYSMKFSMRKAIPKARLRSCLLGTGTGAIMTSCATSEIGIKLLLTIVSSSTCWFVTVAFLFSVFAECPDAIFPAENLESKLVMPVEFVRAGADCFPALFPLVSPLVEGETSGVSSSTPFSSERLGRLLGERMTTVGGCNDGRILLNGIETFLTSSRASSTLPIRGSIGGAGSRLLVLDAIFVSCEI